MERWKCLSMMKYFQLFLIKVAIIQQIPNTAKYLPSSEPNQEQVMKSSLYSKPFAHIHHGAMKVSSYYEI